MTLSEAGLDRLIALRKREREDEQAAHTREAAGKVEAALGARVVAALDHPREPDWRVADTVATRKFMYRNTEFHLVVTAMIGVNRVELELRHQDQRFAPQAKKAGLAELGEDWFLNALEMLANQIQDRLANPRNFV